MKTATTLGNRGAGLYFSLLSLFIGVFLLSGCGGGSDDGGNNNPPAATTRTVAVSGFSFGGAVTVKSGTKVKWQNGDGAPHNVIWDAFTPNTSPGPGSNIPTFNGGATSQEWVAPTVTVNTTYNYHCGIHPAMVSNIVVTP